MWLFADAIRQGRPIKLFNHGRMRRDFTYVDDVVEAVVRLFPAAYAEPGVVGDAPTPPRARPPGTSTTSETASRSRSPRWCG